MVPDMPRVGPPSDNSVSKAAPGPKPTQTQTPDKTAPKTQPETPSAKGWTQPSDNRQNQALQQTGKTTFTPAAKADPAATAQKAIAEFMELRGDAPRTLSG